MAQALQISLAPHCTLLPPDEFNGTVPQRNPRNSLSGDIIFPGD